MENVSKDFLDTLSSGLDYYKYNISDNQMAKLILFNTLVMETNTHTNLTTIKDGADSAKKHFLDALNPIATDLISKAKKVIDVGSGAGFPGIPLAIMYPDVHFTLLDTLKKRCDFMQDSVVALELENVEIVWQRAETLGQTIGYREEFDVACARALASMPTLLEYLLPFIRVGGYAVFYKGKSPENEITQSANAMSLLGVDNFSIVPYTIFDETAHYCMVIGEKNRPTPAKYPRKAGLPTKRPL